MRRRKLSWTELIFRRKAGDRRFFRWWVVLPKHYNEPDLVAGKYDPGLIKISAMKAICHISVLLISLFLATSVFSEKTTPAMFRQIHIVFSAKAYWDGETKSCIPREKGGCCHIWTEKMEPGPGEISGELVLVKGTIVQLTASRVKGMNKETYMKYFSDGKFNIDGPITFDPNVLSQLGIGSEYVVPSGTYPVTINGDMLTITFK